VIEKLIIFIVFLCPLVFFHELGHFLFARLFRVRVEVFSLGFGPKLFKKKWGDTEYAFSLIPLGGYVKMFGDDPMLADQIPASERDFSYTFKNKWQRFCIVFGGPFANFILAGVIFYFLLVRGERLPEMRIGVVPATSTFYSKGVRSGDVLQKVNGKQVFGPSDVAMEDAAEIKSISVLRHGQEIEVPMHLATMVFFENLMSHPPMLRKPIIVSQNGDKFALSESESKVDWNLSLDQIDDSKGLKTLYLFKIIKLGGDISEIDEIEKTYSKKLDLTYATNLEFLSALQSNNFRSLDLSIKSISMGSPAETAGFKANDVLIQVDQLKINSFEDLRSYLQNTIAEVVEVSYWREGREFKANIKPQIQSEGEKPVKIIGVYSAGEYLGLNFIQTESKGIFASFPLAFIRTWETIIKTIEGFKKLITNQVPLKSIGGPVAIAKVATDSYNTSFSYFFQLMAIISVNLGIINLFPIPVLDGGHIMFIILEVLNRGPLSRRKMEIAQQFGLSLLLLLTFVALFNDFSKFF
jgi:regulator of sigma E protease